MSGNACWTGEDFPKSYEKRSVVSWKEISIYLDPVLSCGHRKKHCGALLAIRSDGNQKFCAFRLRPVCPATLARIPNYLARAYRRGRMGQTDFRLQPDSLQIVYGERNSRVTSPNPTLSSLDWSNDAYKFAAPLACCGVIRFVCFYRGCWNLGDHLSVHFLSFVSSVHHPSVSPAPAFDVHLTSQYATEPGANAAECCFLNDYVTGMAF